MANPEKLRERTKKFFEANGVDTSLVPMNVSWGTSNGVLHYEKFVTDAHGAIMWDQDGTAHKEECSTPLKVNWEDIA